MRALVLIVLVAAGCDPETDFDPPGNIPHTFDIGEVPHARAPSMTGGILPYYCVDAAGLNQIPCRLDDMASVLNSVDQRDQDQLSCDAAGCHGSYTYEPDAPVSERHLQGANGPSCFTCHDLVWGDANDVNAGAR